MTKVFKCDCCKKIIDTLNISTLDFWSSYTAKRRYVLCPSCVEKFKEFMKAREE